MYDLKKPLLPNAQSQLYEMVDLSSASFDPNSLLDPNTLELERQRALVSEPNYWQTLSTKIQQGWHTTCESARQFVENPIIRGISRRVRGGLMMSIVVYLLIESKFAEQDQENSCTNGKSYTESLDMMAYLISMIVFLLVTPNLCYGYTKLAEKHEFRPSVNLSLTFWQTFAAAFNVAARDIVFLDKLKGEVKSMPGGLFIFLQIMASFPIFLLIMDRAGFKGYVRGKEYENYKEMFKKPEIKRVLLTLWDAFAHGLSLATTLTILALAIMNVGWDSWHEENVTDDVKEKVLGSTALVAILVGFMVSLRSTQGWNTVQKLQQSSAVFFSTYLPMVNIAICAEPQAMLTVSGFKQQGYKNAVGLLVPSSIAAILTWFTVEAPGSVKELERYLVKELQIDPRDPRIKKLLKALTNVTVIKALQLAAPWVVKKTASATDATLPFMSSLGPFSAF